MFYVRFLRCLDLRSPDVTHQFPGIIVHAFCQYCVEYYVDVYTSRLEELLLKIEEKLKEIPYVDKLMGIKGIGVYTFCQYRVEYPQNLTRYRYYRLHLL